MFRPQLWPSSETWAPGRWTVVLERLGCPQKGELWFWRGWVGPRKVNCGFGEAGWAPGRWTVVLGRLGGPQEGELWFWRGWVVPRKVNCGFGEADSADAHCKKKTRLIQSTVSVHPCGINHAGCQSRIALKASHNRPTYEDALSPVLTAQSMCLARP